ncbi:hypothetical protein [Streptomyces diastatochromogenes]|uniref:hypothetical protein n=1 Tax=Streptomyces diastatochromogenes TaxID=42236 RepID=UPI0036B54A33
MPLRAVKAPDVRFARPGRWGGTWVMEHLVQPFIRAAAGSGVRVKTLIRPAGGHNSRTWSGMYPDALGWLSTQLSPPAASR